MMGTSSWLFCRVSPQVSLRFINNSVYFDTSATSLKQHKPDLTAFNSAISKEK